MHKRKFRSHKFTAKMIVVTTPVLLPLTTLASHAQGQSGVVSASRASNTAQSATPATNHTVSIKIPVVGKVTKADGAPAAKALLYITWRQNDGKQQFQQCVADANGKFETTITPTGKAVIVSALVVTALLPGKGMAWTQAGPTDANLANLQLSLLPLSTLEGRLVRADGAPSANTEVCIQSLMPRAIMHNGIAPDLEPAPQSATKSFRGRMGQQTGNFMILPLLPDDALAAQFRAKTDATGKFTLNGLPRETSIGLKPGDKLAMAAGSANMLTILNQERQNGGLFVATPTARVKVRVVDPLTRQPVPQVAVNLTSADGRQNLSMVREGNSMSFHRLMTDASGEMTSPDLLPGEYIVNVLGCVKKVRVESNRDTPPVEIAVRHGNLQGRLLDADGKPLANAEVRLATDHSNGPMTVFDGVVFSNNGFNNFAFSNAAFGFARNVSVDFQDNLGSTVFLTNSLPSMILHTNAEGKFVIGNMPWGSAHVRIWATKGNDMAEWSGPASKADANMTLQMRAGELTTVAGKLVDPERRTLANVTCKALHWLPTLRNTWFATARDVKTDAEGNFKVEGLERGESFSLITIGQQQIVNNRVLTQEVAVPAVTTLSFVANGGVQNALETLGGTRTLTAQIAPIRQDFESPRFLTCSTGDVQRLGEVMVHPQESSEEVLQSYGGSPGDQPLPGVVLAPASGEVQSAKVVLARFNKAVKTGDVDALAELTSRVSPGWSRNRQEFLQHVSLCGRMDSTEAMPTTLPLNFVPRRAIAMLLQSTSPEANVERAERIGETPTDHSDWVFLTQRMGTGVSLAGILHREDGQWRVVANPSFATPEALQMLNGNGVSPGDKWGQAATALKPELQQEAQQTGERYLQAWLNADREQMRRLTSPFALLPSGNLANFRHALERRADDGVCPLATEEKVALHPVGDLSLWDKDWIKQLAGMNVQMAGMSRAVVRTGAQFEVSGNSFRGRGETLSLSGTPETLAPGNDTAVFRYTAQGHDFLMVLTRNNHQWQMLEPALPL